MGGFHVLYIAHASSLYAMNRDQVPLSTQYSTAWGPNLGTWILIGYNFNFAVILRFE